MTLSKKICKEIEKLCKENKYDDYEFNYAGYTVYFTKYLSIIDVYKGDEWLCSLDGFLNPQGHEEHFHLFDINAIAKAKKDCRDFNDFNYNVFESTTKTFRQWLNENTDCVRSNKL